jgi:hypothetical protein
MFDESLRSLIFDAFQHLKIASSRFPTMNDPKEKELDTRSPTDDSGVKRINNLPPVKGGTRQQVGRSIYTACPELSGKT